MSKFRQHFKLKLYCSQQKDKSIPHAGLVSAMAAWLITKYIFRYFETIEPKGFEFLLEVSLKNSPW